ncbi:MAG TPA: amidohydrolase family protein [Bryobacteraceae bacterium]
MSNHCWTRRQILASVGAAFQKPPIIDSHIHLWKLPRNRPPVNDSATFPSGCCGSMPWLEMDRLLPDYNARPGGRKVDKVVLIESSVGVPPDKIIQSNLWMLETAAANSKILSVVGNLDVTQSPATFAAQVHQLSADRKWKGIRIGSGIFERGASHTFANIRPNVMDNLPLLARQKLMIDALGVPGSVLRSVAGAVPGLTIVMDHLADKAPSFDLEDSWKADMHEAAAAPNLYIKVSDIHKLSTKSVIGAAAVRTQFQPIADPARYRPVLDFLFNTFGENRLIFGTNWPVSDAAGKNVDSIDLQIRIVERFLGARPKSRDRVMYQNAERIYGNAI